MINKNVKKFIALALLSFLVVCLVGGVYFTFMSKERSLGDSAARREQIELENGLVYIDPQVVALSGDISAANPLCDVVIDAINAERSKAGLVGLRKNMDLVVAASVRAQEQDLLFSHTRPDGSEWWTVDSRVCYGENLSKGYDANSVTGAWMNSPTHREVIMTDYKTCGVGFYTSSSGTIYIAAEFGY